MIVGVDIKSTMNLSFAGCGFLGIYHVGVASCIREYAPHLAADKIAGASAGAIAAVGLVCNVDLEPATRHALGITLEVRSRLLGPLSPQFQPMKYIREGLDLFLPYDAHKRASGKLHISLTRLRDKKNVLVNNFETRDDLIQALICSAYIPFYCGLIPPKYKGTYYLDGGLSVNIPILDEQTITVSPFAGESDICPQDVSANPMHVHLANTSIQLSTSNLYRFGCIVFPPSPETLSKMCQQGFDDCLTYLRKNNLISCARHLSIYSSITSNTPFPKTTTESTSASGEDEVETAKETSLMERLEHVPEALLDPSVGAYGKEQEAEVELSSAESSSWEGSCWSMSCDEEEDETHSCEECNYRRTLAVPDSLPMPVVTALQAACDSVNSGLFGYLNRMQAFRVLALMASPAYLPIEITYSLTKRFYEWVPYMPANMQWFVREFLYMLKEIYDFVQASRSSYSARFTCQLAITELDCSSSSDGAKSSIASAPLPPSRPQALPFNSKRHLNVGFSLDFESHGNDPLECVDELRHRLVEEEHEHDVMVMPLPAKESVELELDAITDASPIATPRSRSSSCSRSRSASVSSASPHKHIHHEGGHGSGAHHHGSHHHHHHHHRRRQPDIDSSYDTFENCLHIANQMDSILSYYYSEEGNPNTVRVAEIFPLVDPTAPKRERPVSDVPSAWENAVHAKLEEVQRKRRLST